MITIFTDGSARGNPGPGGWGAIILFDDEVKELGGSEVHTTNNRMELTAVISALNFVPHEHDIILYTDSSYVISGITRWVRGWEKNNWLTSKKEDVLNKDLWELLVDAVAHKIIKWELVKGHSGVPANERCDVIATSFADNNPVGLYAGSFARYGVDLSVTTGDSKISEKKSKSKSKAYSYVSVLDGVVETHKTWEECKARVHGKPARFKKSVSPADEKDIIEEFSH